MVEEHRKKPTSNTNFGVSSSQPHFGSQIGAKKHHSVNAFKKAILENKPKMSENYERDPCDAILGRLKGKVKTKGGIIKKIQFLSTCLTLVSMKIFSKKCGFLPV